jgi:DNA topoisomerase-1
LGEHPDGGGPVNVMDGKYGPYVKWGKINATLPKDVEPTSVDLETAMMLISEKSKKGTTKKKKRKKS